MLYLDWSLDFFHVRVASWNGVGNMYGVLRYSTPASTLVVGPPAPPTNIIAHSYNSSAVKVSWSESMIWGHDTVNEYLVEWDFNSGQYEVQRIRFLRKIN